LWPSSAYGRAPCSFSDAEEAPWKTIVALLPSRTKYPTPPGSCVTATEPTYSRRRSRHELTGCISRSTTAWRVTPISRSITPAVAWVGACLQERERVANVPPGTVRIDCYSRSWSREKAFTIESRTIKVLAGDSGYKSAKLDCPRGKLAGGMGPYSEREMGGRGDPVELLRRELSGSLKEGDVVEIAGNTQNRDEKTVGVVRDGEVVANAHYIQVSDGWL
jgi:hypothetical protein